MNPPSKACMRAIECLTEHHQDDAAAYYSLNGESAVIVINDKETLALVVNVLQVAMADWKMGNSEDLLSLIMIPDEPIEA